ncbi:MULTISPECIES: phasin family protein [unclassified Mesorhizobium]|uniref:phasin family protein n=1 Tax=unclassified Mesorhizobium TaxID=325217 RepID=UPI0013ED2480|nr:MULTISPECIES: phasin family protein [unclassified Mesorhizobium]
MSKATSFGPDVQAVSDQIKEMVGQFKVPGIDAQAMVEQQRKNIGAAVEAMRVGSKGTHTVAERQLELFHVTSTQLLSLFTEQKLTPEERTNLAKEAFEAALAGSRDLYDITAKASEEAYSIAKRRVTDGVEEFRKHLDRKATEK